MHASEPKADELSFRRTTLNRRGSILLRAAMQLGVRKASTHRPFVLPRSGSPTHPSGIQHRGSRDIARLSWRQAADISCDGPSLREARGSGRGGESSGRPQPEAARLRRRLYQLVSSGGSTTCPAIYAPIRSRIVPRIIPCILQALRIGSLRSNNVLQHELKRGKLAKYRGTGDGLRIARHLPDEHRRWFRRAKLRRQSFVAGKIVRWTQCL